MPLDPLTNPNVVHKFEVGVTFAFIAKFIMLF